MTVEHAAFAALPADVASDAVRAVEDALYANGANGIGQIMPTGDEGPAAVRALLDLGWRPPLAATPLGDIADT